MAKSAIFRVSPMPGALYTPGNDKSSPDIGKCFDKCGSHVGKVLADLLGGEIVDVGLAVLDELHRPFVELVEVVVV